MSKGVLFDRESAGQIADVVKHSWPRGHIGRPIETPLSGYRPDLCGILLDDLEPATHPRLGAKSARVRCYAPDPTNPPDYPTPRVPQLTTRIEWCVNRDLDATAAKGTFVVIRWTSLVEWHWVVLGCGPNVCSESVDWTWDGSVWNQDVDTLGGNECADGCFAPVPDDTPSLPGATATTDCTEEALEGYLG